MWVACPYTAPFFLLLPVTNLLGRAGGFAAWTVLSLLLYTTIVRGLTRGSGRRDPLLMVAPFAFLPFLYNLYLGQLGILMAFGLYRSYRALQDGREFAAGCWLGLVLLKPQFAVLLAIVLLGKRRWSALGGLMVSGIGLAASTLVLVGADGVRDYLDILRAFSGFRHVPLIVYPQDMISFRGLLVNVLPESWSENQGTIAALALSIAMALSLVVVWRGRWDPSSDRFPRQLLATVIVAMLTCFHNQIHGAILLIVPMLATLSRRRDPDPLPARFALFIFAPTIYMLCTSLITYTALMFIGLMLWIHGTIFVEFWRDQGPGLQGWASPERLRGEPMKSRSRHRRGRTAGSRSVS